MPDQDPSVLNPNPGGETPGAVVTIEDTRTGSGGGGQQTPPGDPNDPNSPPSGNRGTGDSSGNSGSLKITVQLPAVGS